MEATEAVKEEDYSEAEHVDSQYEYLIRNKDKGITLDELCQRRTAGRDL